MARLRLLAVRTLDALVVVLFLFFLHLVGAPHLWNGRLGIAWLVVLCLLCLSFAVAIAIGIRRRRATDRPPV